MPNNMRLINNLHFFYYQSEDKQQKILLINYEAHICALLDIRFSTFPKHLL